MGVAGCGKSSVAQAVTQRLGWPMIEGDDYHAEASRTKMRDGVPLTDADRESWLDQLGALLAEHGRRGEAAGLTCSALKRAYRDRLRQHSAGLRFVYLEIDKAHSLQRVASRAGHHLFPASLVDSQFATLESPQGEVGVLCVDALHGIEPLADQIIRWLRP